MKLIERFQRTIVKLLRSYVLYLRLSTGQSEVSSILFSSKIEGTEFLALKVVGEFNDKQDELRHLLTLIVCGLSVKRASAFSTNLV